MALPSGSPVGPNTFFCCGDPHTRCPLFLPPPCGSGAPSSESCNKAKAKAKATYTCATPSERLAAPTQYTNPTALPPAVSFATLGRVVRAKSPAASRSLDCSSLHGSKKRPVSLVSARPSSLRRTTSSCGGPRVPGRRDASLALCTLRVRVPERALEPSDRTPFSPPYGACTAASTRRAAPPASPGCTSASPGSSTRHASVRSRTRSYAVFAGTRQAESARARTRKNNSQTPRTPVPLRCCGPPHGVVREPPGPGGPLRYPLPATDAKKRTTQPLKVVNNRNAIN